MLESGSSPAAYKEMTIGQLSCRATLTAETANFNGLRAGLNYWQAQPQDSRIILNLSASDGTGSYTCYQAMESVGLLLGGLEGREGQQGQEGQEAKAVKPLRTKELAV